MPKRRTIPKRLRAHLTDPEIVELLAGHPRSLFPTPDAFLAAWRRLRAEMTTWDPLDFWRWGLQPDGSPFPETLGGEALRDLARQALEGRGAP